MQRHAAHWSAVPPHLAHDRRRGVPARPEHHRSPARRDPRYDSRHLGRALAHYTQALTPLIALTTTVQHKLDSLDNHSRLLAHLDDAGRALSAARTALEAPQPPAAPSAPAPAPSAPLAPAARRRA